jgi:hypothetical protein
MSERVPSVSETTGSPASTSTDDGARCRSQSRADAPDTSTWSGSTAMLPSAPAGLVQPTTGPQKLEYRASSTGTVKPAM